MRNVNATKDAVCRVASVYLDCKQVAFTKATQLPVESLADEMIRGRTVFTYFCT